MIHFFFLNQKKNFKKTNNPLTHFTIQKTQSQNQLSKNSLCTQLTTMKVTFKLTKTWFSVENTQTLQNTHTHIPEYPYSIFSRHTTQYEREMCVKVR